MANDVGVPITEHHAGARLRKCREAKNWTVAKAVRELARVTGDQVSVFRWNHWESGLSNVPVYLTVSLGVLFDSDSNEFY